MTKDVIAAIIERRSVRRFTDEEVPMATVGRILDAACHAPSAGNLQPWEFYVVKNREMREKLAVAALNQEFVATAPVVIVVCALPELSARRYGDRGRYLYAIQDTAAAVQNILLAAHGYGLATCWVGAFDEEKVVRLLQLPPGRRPVALIPLGYAAEEKHVAPARRSWEEVVHIIE